MIDLDSHYQHILSELEKGHRGLVQFSSEELEELTQLLKNQESSKENLVKTLCLVEFSAKMHAPFEEGLITILNHAQENEIIVHALNASRKHIIEARFQKGNRLEFDFLEALKKLLHHSDPEVVEWTLRTIEACGPQGIYFQREFVSIKPPVWKLFNSHQRAVLEIITLLERRWNS